MSKHGVPMRPIEPQWGSWAVSVTGDVIARLFQSREVSCVEVQVDDTRMKTPYTSEVIDLNGLSIFFAMKDAGKCRAYLVAFSLIYLHLAW